MCVLVEQAAASIAVRPVVPDDMEWNPNVQCVIDRRGNAENWSSMHACVIWAVYIV